MVHRKKNPGRVPVEGVTTLHAYVRTHPGQTLLYMLILFLPLLSHSLFPYAPLVLLPLYTINIMFNRTPFARSYEMLCALPSLLYAWFLVPSLFPSLLIFHLVLLHTFEQIGRLVGSLSRHILWLLCAFFAITAIYVIPYVSWFNPLYHVLQTLLFGELLFWEGILRSSLLGVFYYMLANFFSK